MKENCQKIKLLKLVEILRHETDETHMLRTRDICARLVSMGITCDPRTLHKDIRLLNSRGYEIMSELVGHECAYYIADRNFSVPELRILMDAVQAAGFITPKKTRALIDKIAALGSISQAAELQSDICIYNNRKHLNETIFYSVDAINTAIRKNRQLTFRYFDLDENGERVLRKNGGLYTVEPVALVLHEDYYYLITYNTKHEGTANYRVDRMERVGIAEESVSEATRNMRERVPEYMASAFKMFNGEVTNVTLRFRRELLGPVFDRFGEDAKVRRIDESFCAVTAPVQVSQTFWGWLYQFGSDMTVIAPASVREESRKRTRTLFEQYEKTEQKE